MDGRVVLKENFKVLLEKNKKLLIFGEDTGKIGDVNQGLEGLQEILEKREFQTEELEKQLLLVRELVWHLEA